MNFRCQFCCYFNVICVHTALTVRLTLGKVYKIRSTTASNRSERARARANDRESASIWEKLHSSNIQIKHEALNTLRYECTDTDKDTFTLQYRTMLTTRRHVAAKSCSLALFLPYTLSLSNLCSLSLSEWRRVLCTFWTFIFGNHFTFFLSLRAQLNLTKLSLKLQPLSLCLSPVTWCCC